MPRLTNSQGVTVNVDDATAATLGAGWTRLDQPKSESSAPEKKPAAASRTAAKK